MKRISILGSTGSIGTNTLKVAEHLRDSVEVVALAAGSNIDLLEEQARKFNPSLIAVYDSDKAKELQHRLPNATIIPGMEGLKAVASHPDADLVVSAITGTLGLVPTITAIEAKKTVGLANKEALVSGGELVISLAKQNNVQIIPIDSEHSAIFQCLNGEDPSTIRRIILTSSGGPFRNFTTAELSSISPDQALNHPTWSMGPKVTIDSSTLMNKGLEVIEAYWLFDVKLDQIEVVVHPQSIVHSMVEYQDLSIIAQMGDPSMITPIQYAITYPERKPGLLQPFDITQPRTLEFFPPDQDKFRCLSLAYEAIRQGGTLPCYMNAANEILVYRFLQKEIGWKEIATSLEDLMQKHQSQDPSSLEVILETDKQARSEAQIVTR